MSTYYYTKIYTRKNVEEDQPNTNEWEEVDSGCVNTYKNILLGWDSPLDSIFPGESLSKKAKTYYTFEYLGLFDKNDFLKKYNTLSLKDVDSNYKNYNRSNNDSDCFVVVDNNKNPICFNNKEDASKAFPEQIEVYNKSELERFEKYNLSYNSNYILFDDFIALSDDQKKEKYINVYYKCEHEYSGQFFNVEAFRTYHKVLENRYKESFQKKILWENTKKSLDYLKLNSDEQENVASNFEYIDEDLEELSNQLYTCNYFITLANWFGDDKNYSDYDWRGRDVLFYIYSC